MIRALGFVMYTRTKRIVKLTHLPFPTSYSGSSHWSPTQTIVTPSLTHKTRRLASLIDTPLKSITPSKNPVICDSRHFIFLGFDSCFKKSLNNFIAVKEKQYVAFNAGRVLYELSASSQSNGVVFGCNGWNCLVLTAHNASGTVYFNFHKVI